MSTENVTTYLYCYSTPSCCSLIIVIISHFLWYSHVKKSILSKWLMLRDTIWTKVVNLKKKVKILCCNLRLWKLYPWCITLGHFRTNCNHEDQKRNMVLIFSRFCYLCYSINMDLFHRLQSLQLCKYSFTITNPSFWHYRTCIDWNVAKYESQLKVLYMFFSNLCWLSHNMDKSRYKWCNEDISTTSKLVCIFLCCIILT